MAQDDDADKLGDEARQRLHRYGIDVEEAAAVEIHPDTRALGDREDARGGYSPHLDTIQLYEPLFGSGAGPEEALVHEYMHKYQIDSRVGPPGEDLHATVAELDELSERYAAMLEDLDHEDTDAIGDLGAGGITGEKALLSRLSLAVDPGMAEQIHDLAVAEYGRLEDEHEKETLRTYFEAALAWEAEQCWGEAARIVGPLADRTTSMDLAGVSIGPEEEAFAYYAGIAAAGRVDDADYIEEIRDPDRTYDDPQRQVEVLDELLEAHRSLVAEGRDRDEAVRTILSRWDE